MCVGQWRRQASGSGLRVLLLFVVVFVVLRKISSPRPIGARARTRSHTHTDADPKRNSLVCTRSLTDCFRARDKTERKK